MAKARVKDLFVNRALVDLVMSAANTLTFQEIRFGIGMFQGVALVLHRLDLYIDVPGEREVVAATDSYSVALTTSDEITSLTSDQQAVLFLLNRVGIAAVAGNGVQQPITNDLSTLPGGGMIMPANPLYLGMTTGGFAALSRVRAVLYHTFRELSDADYLELIQGTMRTNI